MKKFSLIMATINREKEVKDFFESLENIDYNLNDIEIVIVDQNKNGLIDKIVEEFKEKMCIKHLKSNLVGLSKNRNLGLDNSSGEIVCFPDDDCKILKNTLKKVEEKFKENTKIRIVLGRIIDEKGNDSLKKWDKFEKKLGRINFFSKVSSITIFSKNTKIKFDEQLGVGAKFGSCEDMDYIYNILKYDEGIYSPEIILYHPQADIKNFSQSKAYNYGLGFGAFFGKRKGLIYTSIYCCIIIKVFFKMIVCLLKNREQGLILWNSLKGRCEGFFRYLNGGKD
ncbi:MAG: glycosyltransferase family 2 protein [Cetobacterium sp.]|uniref:glycosyltransferase family 2 protein n=1 Tax=Cetobacterium sp. TaxID=2071632 RepID=UPI003EE6CD07